MAAISSISNGEAMSSVRTKLNSVITEINLLDPTDWIDYSATSSILGWSNFTAKQIRYRIVGKQMFVSFYLSGTSNSTGANFTLPNQNKNIEQLMVMYGVNNGAMANYTYIYCLQNSSTVTLYQNNTANWASSGVKTAWGQFFIEIA